MSELRIGHGYDIHRLQAGGQLVMGGIVVADGVSAIAHSDGDVVVHAVVDALLGALGLGDIGEHFPNTDPAYRGAAGGAFLDKMSDFLTAGGWRVVNCDVTITAERPKLAAFKPAMVQYLRGRLACDAVNVKAGTNEGCGEIGRGEAVSAEAVLLIARQAAPPQRG